MSESGERDIEAAAWWLPLVVWSVVLLIASVVDLATNELDGADQSFFSTAAQIGPVIGLGVFVEIAVVMAPVMKTPPEPPERSGPTLAERTAVALLVRLNVGLLLISEGAALYATGARQSSGFLVLCTVLPWLVQLALVVDAAYHRVGLRVAGGRRR